MPGGNGHNRTDKSWDEQFDGSLRRWSVSRKASRFSLTDPLQSAIDDVVRELREIDPNPTLASFHEPATKILREDGQSEALAKAFRALLHFRVRDILLVVGMAVRSCTTAIEIPMLMALIVAGKARIGRIRFGNDIADEGWDLWGHMLEIEPQMKIGEYRVDFLVTLTYPVADPSKTITGGVGRRAKKIVVECDGHDFHDRTKEQARKDRSRDRALQMAGYQVFRYTGSEIWSDVFACAHEVVSALMKEANKDGNQNEFRVY